MTSPTPLNAAIAAESATTKKDPVEVFRKDYTPLSNIVTKITMNFDIYDNKTTVTSELTIAPNPKAPSSAGALGDLVLDGDESCIKVYKIELNGRDLTQGTEYEFQTGQLIIKQNAFEKEGNVLKTMVEIVPEENTQLSGLYKSGPMYCSQCEALGFRRITYYPDRPDNMAIFEKVRIEANKSSYPILLSNGNLITSGDCIKNNTKEDSKSESSDRHFAIWSDPFPKPSYLFCVVAGDLGSIKDKYTTMSGKDVHLEIFSEKENVGKLDHAMASLKHAMKWDEDTFGLEYDLGIYNIVAVNDFNMGAMENKGLNVFNTALTLADPATATDNDYERIEGVIGHEYFHNWTGNRVTCKDWFQLTLKEGLTVFRDQCFSGDMGSNAVKRIEDVLVLRGHQFREDAGPLSHPIRPDSYVAMDNFYTATVYCKGAEIIRMYQTILSKEGFRKGMDLYFKRHDGDAVTCDDFRAAMADANGVDLDQFGLWYSTPGTPVVTYSTEFDSSVGVLKLTLTQSSKNDKPMFIPISFGLIDKTSGEEVVPTTVLELKEMTQTFEFDGLKGDVVPSILREFSAPVKLVPSTETDEESLKFLAAKDTDNFNRWEAGQKLYSSLCFQEYNDKMSSTTLGYVLEAFEDTLNDTKMDFSIKSYALTLPTESTLSEDIKEVDPVKLRQARGAVKKAIAKKFQDKLLASYNDLTNVLDAVTEFKVDAESIGRRRLRNTILGYITAIKETEEEQTAAANIALSHYDKAKGMTDKMAAFNALASMDGAGAEVRDKIIKRFYDEANGDALVLNKWFAVQAMANLPDVLDRVKELTKHPDFTLSNPNRCRSLISSFTMNLAPFHAADGEGYKFIGETIAELDKLNPQLSSRIGKTMITWKKYGKERADLMKAELQKLAEMKLSDDLYEVVNSGLK